MSASAPKAHIFPHQREPSGDWVIEVQGAVVATGGFLCHYNPPYGDIFMEVAEPARRLGFGSYLVQELKRVCYEAGKKPGSLGIAVKAPNIWWSIQSLGKTTDLTDQKRIFTD